MRTASAHLVMPDGVLRSGGPAFAAALRALRPPAAWIGAVLDRPRAQALVAGLYDAVATRRGRLARFLPDVEPTLRRPTRLPAGPTTSQEG